MKITIGRIIKGIDFISLVFSILMFMFFLAFFVMKKDLMEREGVLVWGVMFVGIGILSSIMYLNWSMQLQSFRYVNILFVAIPIFSLMVLSAIIPVYGYRFAEDNKTMIDLFKLYSISLNLIWIAIASMLIKSAIYILDYFKIDIKVLKRQ